MDRQFWLDKWGQGQIGFHMNEVHPDLEARAPSFLAGGPHRVLVPLCGKSHDIDWLARQGHQVTAVELSDIAARDFHAEHQRVATTSKAGAFTEWSSPNLRYLVGDVLQLEGRYDRVWDRAAMVALPPPIRKAYVATLRRVASGGELLLVTFHYDQAVMKGPPFSIPAEEVRGFYPEAELLWEGDVIDQVAKFKARGHTHWHKQIWRVPIPREVELP